jgi:hypothetical protein
MVNGLRYYPVANAVAQTFLYSLILNETGVPAALTKSRGQRPRLHKERRFLFEPFALASQRPKRRIQKRRLEGAVPCLATPLLFAENYPRFGQIIRR